jgi:hypothetical protein
MILRTYVYVIAAAALTAGGAYVAQRMTAASYQADIIKEQAAKAAAIKAAAEQANQHAEELEKARAKREIIYRTITKRVDRIVDRPVYINDCLDDDGLRIANDALAGSATTAGEPDAAVSGTDADGWEDRR